MMTSFSDNSFNDSCEHSTEPPNNSATDNPGSSSIHGFLSHYQQKTNTTLKSLIDTQQPALELTHNNLLNAIEYSLFAGGKRLRPCLVYAAAQATKRTHQKNMPAPNDKDNNQNTSRYTCTDIFAAAIEAIHTYSLIHDDLPPMDDDDLRRGQPTCHIQYDEATAILAGDALQSLAFEWLSDSTLGTPKLTPVAQLQALNLLAKASGAQGMVLGQAIDLASVNKPLTINALEHMHNLKTGALISASIELGAISGHATAAELSAMRAFARCIGLAFQVHDDILDVTTDSITLGKPQGADAHLNKPTYVSLLGLDSAIEKRNQLILQSHQHIASLGDAANTLKALADYIISRNH